MNAPAHQINQVAAQLGLLDPTAGGAGLGGLGALSHQQKLAAAAAAAQRGFAPPPPPQRAPPRPLLTQQQQLQHLYAQQASQQARSLPSLQAMPFISH
jgi:hypothetical protein